MPHELITERYVFYGWPIGSYPSLFSGSTSSSLGLLYVKSDIETFVNQLNSIQIVFEMVKKETLDDLTSF